MSLVARELSVGYGHGLVVLSASCQVTAGRVTALLGPNGSGKSTLLRSLARALAPRQGRVLLDDRNLYALSPRQAARCLAYVPQEDSVGFDFTVRELVGLGAAAAAGASAGHVARALHLLDLEPLAGRSLLSLSGGERQRAAVARALAQDTPYLLLDEPTAHLDLRHQIHLLQTLQRLAREQGRAVLVVLHDLNLAAAYADTLFLLHEGRIVAHGTPAVVLTPELLGPVYQTSVYIKRHPASGRPWVLAMPLPSSAGNTSGRDGEHPGPVHILCGGGTGTLLMAALGAARVPVTAGILSPLDSDAETAQALGIFYTPDAPFSAISEAALRADAPLRRGARHVVVADFPIGPGNLALLHAAAESAAAGQSLVLVAGDPVAARDFTGGEGQRLWESLVPRARLVNDPEALVNLVLQP